MAWPPLKTQLQATPQWWFHRQPFSHSQQYKSSFTNKIKIPIPQCKASEWSENEKILKAVALHEIEGKLKLPRSPETWRCRRGFLQRGGRCRGASWWWRRRWRWWRFPCRRGWACPCREGRGWCERCQRRQCRHWCCSTAVASLAKVEDAEEREREN